MKIKNLIGNKKDFAIEYEINNSYNNFLYGKFCYWINEVQLGDYEQLVTFNDLLVSFPQILLNNNIRENKKYFNMSLQDFEENIKYYNSEIYPFNILPLIDIFYNMDIYLIEYNNKARFIIQKYDNNKYFTVFEYYTKKQIFNNIFYKAYLELNEYFDKFINKNIF